MMPLAVRSTTAGDEPQAGPRDAVATLDQRSG